MVTKLTIPGYRLYQYTWMEELQRHASHAVPLWAILATLQSWLSLMSCMIIIML